MKEFHLTENRTITIDTAAEEFHEYRLEADRDCQADVIITIEGSKDSEITLDVTVNRDARIRVLTINHSSGKIVLNEHYRLYGDSDTVIAHAELNPADTTLNAVHELMEPGARLTVNSATMCRSRKLFNQDTLHHAGNTSAQINNYGVVLADGYCDMVVRNTIDKGAHKASTHQASRLLTYDKTAVGKILPILYINDNDIEASHAASMGQPDEEQLYYLQSRGMSRNEALKLIIVGYLLPITKVIDDDKLVSTLTEEIETKVAEGCSM